jgi:ArsR family transcriptional regulator, arsenate/arsenite/antimonite-responsive transcriptional repressor
MNEITRLAAIYKALSDPTRLRLFKILAERQSLADGSDDCGNGPLCVNALTHKAGITQSAVSQHLRVLKQAGLIQGERRGAFVHYSVDPAGIELFKTTIGNVLGSIM